MERGFGIGLKLQDVNFWGVYLHTYFYALDIHVINTYSIAF